MNTDRPSDEAIIAVIALNYRVSLEVALQWLADMDVAGMIGDWAESITPIRKGK